MTPDGHRRYAIAIAGFYYEERFEDRKPLVNVVARADLFTTGGGSLPRLESVRRLGPQRRYLALAGTYRKPNSSAAAGRWMFLTDLARHRSWSAHW